MRYYTRGFVKSAGILDDVIHLGKHFIDYLRKKREVQTLPSMLRWDRLNPLPKYIPQSTDLAVQRQQYLLWLNNIHIPWRQTRDSQTAMTKLWHKAFTPIIEGAMDRWHPGHAYSSPSKMLPVNMHSFLEKSLGGVNSSWREPYLYSARLKDLYIGMYKDKKIGLRNWENMIANRTKLWKKRGGPDTIQGMPHVPPRPRNIGTAWAGPWSYSPDDAISIYGNWSMRDGPTFYPKLFRGVYGANDYNGYATLPKLILPQFKYTHELPNSPTFGQLAIKYSLPRHLIQGHGLARTTLALPVGSTLPLGIKNLRDFSAFLDYMPVSDRVDYIGYVVPLMAGAMIRFKPDATNAFGETPATFDLAANNFMTHGYAEYDPKSNMVRMTKKYVDIAKVPDPDMLPLLTAWYRAKHPLAVPKQLQYNPFFTPRSTEMKLYQPPLGYDPTQWLLDALFYYRMSNNIKKLRDKYVG